MSDIKETTFIKVRGTKKPMEFTGKAINVPPGGKIIIDGIQYVVLYPPKVSVILKGPQVFLTKQIKSIESHIVVKLPKK